MMQTRDQERRAPGVGHALLLAVTVEGVACERVAYVSGASEPIQVREGAFLPGELPHDSDAETPTVVYAASVGYVIPQGRGSVFYDGLVSEDAHSVGIAFDGVGSGYWVLPAQGPDVTQDNALVFGATIDFSVEVPYGLQGLSFVAFDGEGNAGPRYGSTICVLPEVAGGNFSACDPAVVPQNAIISLTWSTNVDLDLIVITPDGRQVTSKSPTTALPDEDGNITSEALGDPSTGTLSRDSNGNCDIDGLRRESLVFPGAPPAGDYHVYANLFSDCGHAHVVYNLDLIQRVDADDGTYPVETTRLAGGQLLSENANGGEAIGTYITTVSFP